MNALKIESTRTTPEIVLNPDGMLWIKGRSIHENVAEFYEPVDNWVNEYIESPAELTHVDMNLEYFNSSSAKLFIQILQKITYVTLKDKKFSFNWYFEDGDDDILERGEYFSSILDVPFNFIRTKSTQTPAPEN
jgi:hypothetical protein